MSTDRVRRGATVLALVAVLLAVPQLAAAKFFAGATATQSVSAATLVTPTDVSGTFTCRTYGSGMWSTETVSVDVRQLSARGQVTGVRYEYVLVGTSWSAFDKVDSDHGQASLYAVSMNGPAKTTWTLSVRAVRGNWESSNLVTTLTCPAAGDLTAGEPPYSF